MARPRKKSPATELVVTDEAEAKAVNPLALASPLVDRTHLVMIVMVGDEAKRDPDLDQDLKNYAVSTRIVAVGVAFNKEAGQLVVEPRFELTVKESPDAEASKLTIATSFAVIYECKDVVDMKEENYTAFGQTTGLLNAWPYWRQHVSYTCSMMGLRPIVLPLYRLEFRRP